MRPVLLLQLIVAAGLPFTWGHAKEDSIRNCRQCLVVLADSWRSIKGTMQCFERDNPESPWRAHDSEIPVSLGEAGLAWGRGVVVSPRSTFAPKKHEGDHKAPAGVFFLGQAFGFAPTDEARWIKLPYLALSPDIQAVDDPRSRYYNQVVARSRIANPDWQSSEQMFRGDQRYKWGVVVAHNTPPEPGAGSCIFLHIWKEAGIPTVGCTAMSEKNLVKVLHWLDPALHPLLVQMPRKNYSEFQTKWSLPVPTP
jgi:hypothetical protein